MAIIDIETADIGCRLILSNHRLIVDGLQFPKHHTTLAMEFGTNRESDYYQAVQNGPILVGEEMNPYHYISIVSQCRKRNLPFMTSEPLYQTEGMEYLRLAIETDTCNSLASQPALIRLKDLAAEPEVISRDSKEFQKLESDISIVIKGKAKSASTLRELMMVHRGVKVAMSHLTMVCGIIHGPGIVHALEMDSETRIACIKQHPLLNILYEPSGLRLIDYSAYESGNDVSYSGRYVIQSLTDESLIQQTVV